MFERLSQYPAIIVTGPHRSGTTICAEMIGHDTGLPVHREEAFDYRNITKAEALIREGGVFQGPNLLPWVPILPAHPVYVMRSHAEIRASVEKLRKRGISMPFFDCEQAWRLWQAMDYPGGMIAYEDLQHHPLWRDHRTGWGHRQTC